MKKFDKRYIYYNLVSDFFGSIFVSFILCKDLVYNENDILSMSSNYLLIPAILSIVIYIFFITYRILYYNASGYLLAEKQIECNRGVVFKKRSVLDYSKINAINKKQNLIQRIFGIAILTIDSGSTNTSHQAEITIIEKSRIVDELLYNLQILREGGVVSKETNNNPVKEEEVLLSEESSLYHFTSKKKWLYVLINIVSVLFFTVVIGVVCSSIISICNIFLELDMFSSFGDFILTSVSIVSGILVFISFISFLGCMIQAFVGYYDFKIIKRANDIQISYGFLERHTNTFGFDRIKGVKIKQSLVQRMLGFASIHLEVIGYANNNGNNNIEIGVLVPFCKFCEVNKILQAVLPDYLPQDKNYSAISYFPFISWFSLFLLVIVSIISILVVINFIIFNISLMLMVAVIFAILGCGLLVYIVELINAYLNFKTSGIAFNNDKVTVYSGGMNKTITVFKTINLVSVEDITTPLRKRKGIITLVLHLKTNSYSNEIKVQIQKDSLTTQLENLLVL